MIRALLVVAAVVVLVAGCGGGRKPASPDTVAVTEPPPVLTPREEGASCVYQSVLDGIDMESAYSGCVEGAQSTYGMGSGSTEAQSGATEEVQCIIRNGTDGCPPK